MPTGRHHNERSTPGRSQTNLLDHPELSHVASAAVSAHRGEKFHIATLDSFDRGTFALGALFGAEGQLGRANPSFGDAAPAYARYFATAYADYAIGDYMTEAIFPVMLHQDPRCFRRGTGGFWSRIGYAAGQIFWTHGDSGHGQFNISEVAGNSTALRP